MGEGVNEATVTRWLKPLGAWVQKNEPILEVSTDKVDTEIVAQNEGFLIGIFVEMGVTVSVLGVLGQIGKEKHLTPVRKDQKTQSVEVSSQPKKTAAKQADHRLPASYAGPLRASPLVRRMAKDYGYPLGAIQGSGLYGRIIKDDLLLAMGQEGSGDQGNPVPKLSVQLTEVEGVPVRRVPMDKIRRLTAHHMTEAVRRAPHVTTTMEIDLTRVVEHRVHQAEEGIRLSFTNYFLWASVQALRAYPDMNALVEGEDILYRDSIHLGCAVATDYGLLVPVIRDCQEKNLWEIAKSSEELIQKARGKKLDPKDIKGGTFTLTNPGVYGCLHSQPIIPLNQTGILSVGAIVKRPVIGLDGGLSSAPLCQIGITFDHRLVDGEGGARFLLEVKKHLEQGL
jgi:pyruvate/2-oxoglutarate dehydrogenase complex dihydrolipoamide acyltransferase (E2) component